MDRIGSGFGSNPYCEPKGPSSTPQSNSNIHLRFSYQGGSHPADRGYCDDQGNPVAGPNKKYMSLWHRPEPFYKPKHALFGGLA